MAPPKGFKHSEEVRKRMSESHKGKSSGMKGKHHTEETKIKLRKASTGFKHSEETKRRISEIKKGQRHSEETRIKIGRALKGRKRKPFTEETKKKMSIFQKKLWSKFQKSKSNKRPVRRINGKDKFVSHIVWERQYGKIPKGYIIHHKDFNPENNNINNLLMIIKGKHMEIHRRIT